MNILVVTNMLPTDARPYYGIFVQEQTDSFSEQYPDSQLKVLAFNEGGYFRRYVFSAFKLHAALLRFKPDVVHVHYGLTFLPVLLALPLCKLMKIRIVTTFHGSDIMGDNRVTRFASRLAVRFSDAVIGVSQQISDKLAPGHDRVEYLPCGVTAEFHGLARLIKSDRQRKVIFPSAPGRPEKNYALFERLTRQLAEDMGDLKFETVTMEGLTRKQVAMLFKTSACLLMTSNYEGSPQVIKEAILCDLPIVSTAVGDVPRLLENVQDAVVSNDEAELLAGIRQFVAAEQLKDASFRSELKNSVLNDVVSRRLDAVYRSIVLPTGSSNRE